MQFQLPTDSILFRPDTLPTRFVSAVRYGRVPKRSRERGPEDNVATTTTNVSGGVQQLTSATNNNNTSTNNNNNVNNNNNNNNSNANNNNNNSQGQNVIPRVPSAAVVEADQSDADVKQLAVYDVILQVSQAHHAHCGFTEESTRGIVRKPMIIPVSLSHRSVIVRFCCWPHSR